MKKILALILVMVTMLSLVACGGGENKEEVSNETEIENTVDNKEEEKVPEKEETEEKKETEDKKPADTQKPADKTETQKPVDKTETQKPAEKPAEKPVEKPAEKPSEKPEEKPVETPKTAGNTLLADFKAKANSYSSAVSLAEAIASNSIIPFAPATMAVEPGFLSGFDAEIGGFKEGAMFGPVIGAIPFVGYVFILEDGADVQGFISTLKQNANLRWNICVEAEEMVTGNVGNKVFFVMSNKSFEE